VRIDQSQNALASVFELIETSAFHLRSMRLMPFAGSRLADMRLCLAGGSIEGLDALIANIKQVYGVLSTQKSVPPAWISPGFEEPDFAIGGSGRQTALESE
jgi:(p)ppGpp synthase/HD superfamily hydrolase